MLQRAETSAPRPGSRLTTILCDADGNLFDSEVPAFEASVTITNELLAALGSPRRYQAEELRTAALGRNFRSLATDLAHELGTPLSEAEISRWAELERIAVTTHLGSMLRPDTAVSTALSTLAERFRLAVVTSSALARLDRCLQVTELAEVFPDEARFSAYDSLPRPSSKPDPAIYRHALEVLGIEASEAIAIEDAVAGVRSATSAGIPTVGNLVHVPAADRDRHRAALTEAGAWVVVEDWSELMALVPAGGEW